MFALKNFISDIANVCSYKKTNIHSPNLIRKDLIYAQKALTNSNVSSYGSEHSQFEIKLKKYTKSKYIVLVSNGSIALKISLELLGIKKNSEILLPSFNYIAAANSVIHHSAIPHFIEINHNLLIDFDKLEKYLNKISLTKNNKCFNKKTGRQIEAIICLHNYGHLCDVLKLKKIARKFHLKIIEDAAEALGSFYKTKHAGTFGDIGIISFNGNKILTTGGGAALLMRSKTLEQKAKKLINHNKVNHSWKFIYDSPGYNFRLPNINAALGLGQISRIEEIVYQKRKIFLIYEKKLKKYNNIGFLLSENIDQKINYWLQVFILKNKNHKKKIIKTLQKKKIFCRDTWTPLHNFKFMARYPKLDMKITNIMHERSFNLPSGLDIFINNSKK